VLDKRSVSIEDSLLLSAKLVSLPSLPTSAKIGFQGVQNHAREALEFHC
jgi:hypothetical protein